MAGVEKGAREKLSSEQRRFFRREKVDPADALTVADAFCCFRTIALRER